jgi:hypothetical protein
VCGDEREATDETADGGADPVGRGLFVKRRFIESGNRLDVLPRRVGVLTSLGVFGFNVLLPLR